VIVNQIVSQARGVYFKDEQEQKRRKTLKRQSDPQPGSLAEVRKPTKNDLLHVRVDKTRKNQCPRALMRAIVCPNNAVLRQTQASRVLNRKSIEAANDEASFRRPGPA